MGNSTKKILIIAGESSGDRHAADLILKYGALEPAVEFWGIGGNTMAAAGAHLLFRIEQMAFLGFSEVVRHLPFIRRVFKTLTRWIENEQPQAIILVDYPGFNLRMARLAKSKGIAVIYYICPQLWAWGQRRVEKIRRYVDLPLVIFRFEQEFYTRHGIQSHFVGHPLIDEIKIEISEQEFRRKHGLDPDRTLIGLLPGSRHNEVKELLPVMARAAARLHATSPLEWLVAKSTNLPGDLYRNLLRDYPFIRIIEGDTHHVMKYSRVALVASGTATLETGYLGTPMVVLYRVSSLTYLIARRLIRIDTIALANIVLQKKVVPELIQNAVEPGGIVEALDRYLTDREYYQSVSEQLSQIPRLLGEAGAAGRAAVEISRFLRRENR